MARQEIEFEKLLERQEIYDPTNPDKPITVPDCSHTHGFGSFQSPVVADPKDLPSPEDK